VTPPRGLSSKRLPPSGGCCAVERHHGSGGSPHGSPDRLRGTCRTGDWLRPNVTAARSKGSATMLKRHCGWARLRLLGALSHSRFGGGERGSPEGIPSPRRWRSLLHRPTGRGSDGRTSVRPEVPCRPGIAGLDRSIVHLEEDQSPWKDRVSRHRQRWCGTTDSSAEQSLVVGFVARFERARVTGPASAVPVRSPRSSRLRLRALPPRRLRAKGGTSRDGQRGQCIPNSRLDQLPPLQRFGVVEAGAITRLHGVRFRPSPGQRAR
jgi:hypothetical protein